MAESARSVHVRNPGAGALALEADLPAEEIGRAESYRLLSLLFAGPLPGDLVATLGNADPDDTALGRSLARLGECARDAGRSGIAADYSILFIGAPSPRLMPYASYYRDGHLFGHTLADLRADLTDLGIAAFEGASEPEDHLATLCEVMAGLILGSFGERAPIAAQKSFFERYLLSWCDRFFDDLEEAEEADRFYRAVAGLGRTFFNLEAEGFRMVASGRWSERK
ncbi:TorA maturation chaperone TorD [Breoghania corrubedonensis]|uniref:TorA maturation chaperone TorD n=1 Tax=Breoghania corrubedonensis TaxID=665038 RepID=A0A2T5VAR2_9HYPH|nr:molecular chaperone TorD family protein [Breoghania corrubedonensis]PTW60839.1 TorA maturation chaperone TorD [Breoghania corrubedonensis]